MSYILSAWINMNLHEFPYEQAEMLKYKAVCERCFHCFSGFSVFLQMVAVIFSLKVTTV